MEERHTIAEIAANIDVLAQFGKGGLRPRVFVWERRRHTITTITASWVEPAGHSKFYHFAVQTDGANVYELCFDQARMTWSLTRIHTDG